MRIFKSTFTRQLAQRHRQSQAHYAEALNDILAGIQEQLAQGHSVSFIGFGAFYTRKQPSAKIKDIRTGRSTTIPAHPRVGFRVGEGLRHAVIGPRKRRRFKFLP